MLSFDQSTQANTDLLTGLYNRQHFDEGIALEWRRAMREGNELSLLMIDVDRFKSYNDEYGDTHGDRCLKAVANVVRGLARQPADLVARYGGEEMAFLLPTLGKPGAAAIAEELRGAIENAGVEHIRNQPLSVVTASIGVATCKPRQNPHHGPDSLVNAADSALYEAKKTGRNKVVAHDLVPFSPPILQPHVEEERLMAVAQAERKSAALSGALDSVARMAAALFNTPMALVSLVGRDQQRFVGRTGVSLECSARDVSFCTYTIAGTDVFSVIDAISDKRFADNPLVVGEPWIRFYAGAPLLDPTGHALGALCVLHTESRGALTSAERALLTQLAELAVKYIQN